MANVESILKVLGPPENLDPVPRTQLDFVKMVRAGIPHARVVSALSMLGISVEAAARAVGVAPRSLARRKGARLDMRESEGFLRLVRVFALASEVLGDERKALSWLASPNRALGGEQPLNLLDTDIGGRAVEDTLGRIAYGIHS
jgi:putative toxin-antitoxin system antitoxin component (TIGR02293 family)